MNLLRHIGQLGLVLGLSFMLTTCKSGMKYEYPFQNPGLDIEVRVNDLLSRLTLEEKIFQLVYNSPAIERLNIPAYNWWNECLHGVGRAGLATVFPQAIGMAAMFDTTQMYNVAEVISDEARAKYNDAVSRGKRGIYQGLTYWSPNINLFRDPRWGRGMETYGEDPYLTGRLGVAFIKGLQGNDPRYLKLVATAKHFVVHSGPESTRHSFDAHISGYDFYNTYLPHFKAAVQEANVQSVMCAYNRYDSAACCGSGFLLNELLRNQWGFDGYVVSDCWAITDFFQGHHVADGPVSAAALALKSGTDLECGDVFPGLIDAVKEGLIQEEAIDNALRRLLKARFMLGMFDPDEMVPYSKIPYSVVDSKEHQQVALEAARKSMVLLKNANNLLPLSKNLKTIAVIGPNANDEQVLLGNYNGFPSAPVTPLEGIIAKVGKETKIIYARGCDLADNLPYLSPVPSDVLFIDSTKNKKGLKAEFFNNTNLKGTPVKTIIHDSVNFNWWEKSPIPEVADDSFSIRWTGVLIPKVSGEYCFGGEGTRGCRIIMGKDTLTDTWVHNKLRYRKNSLVAGKSYKIIIEYYNNERNAIMQFVWSPPQIMLENQAVEAAKKADVVVMCLGLSPNLEGEEMPVEVEGFYGGDRITMDIPKVQLNLLKKIHKLGKPVVLVLLNGSALSINWEKENIPAILEAWYPGQAGGTAIADILFGDYNPAGRLPVTFYKSVNDIPAFDNYNMKGRTYRFFKGEPLFEFGFGLSYSTFNYGEIILDKNQIKPNESVTASVDVTNNGKKAGDEIVQLYVSYPRKDDYLPQEDLKGFSRVTIQPGETKRISFKLNPGLLQTYDDKGQAFIQKGTYVISIGSSSSGRNQKKVSMRLE